MTARAWKDTAALPLRLFARLIVIGFALNPV
jgi:hypothetical protein